MTSTSPISTLPSTTVSPTDSTPTPSNTLSPSNSGQSSSLYLFTFLATLLLLLAVSCAIVIRSFILRRRFRRRIEEALAAGVLIPGALDDGPGLGRRRRDFGEKPKLWEVWVDEHEQVHDFGQEGGSEDDHLGKGEGKWEEILPISATILSSNGPKPLALPTGGSAASLPTPERQNDASFTSRVRGRWPFNRHSPSPARGPREEQNESATELNPEANTYPPSGPPRERHKEEERLQVSVLISMPNPNARRASGSEGGGTDSDFSIKGKGRSPGYDDIDGDGEAEIPDVVFGVAEVGFRP